MRHAEWLTAKVKGAVRMLAAPFVVRKAEWVVPRREGKALDAVTQWSKQATGQRTWRAEVAGEFFALIARTKSEARADLKRQLRGPIPTGTIIIGTK